MAGQLFRAWKGIDIAIVRVTEVALIVVGAIMTVFLILSILGRYVADFSFMFVEAGARFLLVWFFLLGAGLALREKAHVGFEMAKTALPAPMGRLVGLLAHGCVLFFALLLLAGSQQAIALAATHEEPTLGISSLWATLAVPVGIALLTYHQLCIIVEDYRGTPIR
jgi:TRAP-type C4-dicarboxylate transport system permease small subunit